MDIEQQLRSGLELEKGEKLADNVWEAKQKFRQVVVKETTNMKEALAEIKAYCQRDHGQNILRLYDYSITPGKVVQLVLEKAQCSLTEFIDKCVWDIELSFERDPFASRTKAAFMNSLCQLDLGQIGRPSGLLIGIIR
jgi:flagellin-specific chaperone FliS